MTRQSYWYTRTEANDNDNPGFTFSNHPDMRRFDTADRRRNQTEFTLTLAPRDVFQFPRTSAIAAMISTARSLPRGSWQVRGMTRQH